MWRCCWRSSIACTRNCRRGAGEADHLEYHLFTDTPDILPTHNQKVQDKFRRILGERRVKVHTEHRVVRVEPGRIHFQNGAQQLLDEILW
ncbi:MAG: hypothetical protein R3F37_10565 [Candidatus Competibacteraceae bacterium]